MKNNIDLVQAQLEAYNTCDLVKFIESYHPEIVVKLLMDDKIIIQGMKEFITTYENLFKLHPAQICHLKSRVITNDSVIDEEFITGRSSNPDGLHAVAIYGFRENLIDRVWFI
jgi:hypothetical protein